MFSFSTENVQSKNMYKIFTRKEKNESQLHQLHHE